MNKISTFRKIAYLTALCTLFLVGLGGFVRATGAGLACPDWPLCFGRLVPRELQPGVFQEVFHRYVAFVVSISTLYLMYESYRMRDIQRKVFKVMRWVVFILLTQVVLGGLTVLLRLNPFIVTSHLILGTVFFQTLTQIGVKPSFVSQELVSPKVYGRAKLVALFVFIQIAIGGFVGSSGASLACPDIPLCFGALIPENASGPQFLHMTHRVFGVILLLLFIWLLKAVFESECSPRVRRLSWALSVAMCAQIALGFLNVYLMIPVSVTVLHLVVAQAILVGTILLARMASPSTLLWEESSAEEEASQGFRKVTLSES